MTNASWIDQLLRSLKLYDAKQIGLMLTEAISGLGGIWDDPSTRGNLRQQIGIPILEVRQKWEQRWFPVASGKARWWLAKVSHRAWKQHRTTYTASKMSSFPGILMHFKQDNANISKQSGLFKDMKTQRITLLHWLKDYFSNVFWSALQE